MWPREMRRDLGLLDFCQYKSQYQSCECHSHQLSNRCGNHESSRCLVCKRDDEKFRTKYLRGSLLGGSRFQRIFGSFSGK